MILGAKTRKMQINSTVYNISKEYNPSEKDLTIEDLIVNQPFLIRSGSIGKSARVPRMENLNVNFKGCTFNKSLSFDINLDMFALRNLTISFENCLLLGDSVVANKIIEGPENCSITIHFFTCILEDIKFRNVSFAHLGVYNSIITKDYFSVSDCNIKSIQFYNVLGNYGVHRSRESNINVSFGEDNLYLPSSPSIRKAYEEIAIKHYSLFSFPTNILITEPKNLYVEFKLTDESGFKKSYNGVKYSLTKEQINDLNISFNIQTENDTTESISITKAQLEGLELRSLSKTSIEISRCRINKLIMRDLSFASLKIYDLASRIAPESVFESRNVDFSNSTFDKTDLSSYSMVSFYRSTLSNIDFISPNFPDEIHVLDNIYYPHQKEDNYYRMQSENYRQIKKSLVESGNQIEALEIHSKMYSSLQKDKNLTLQDKCILYLNKLSNNHGISIIRPFLLYIGFSIVIFFLYRSTLNEAPFTLGFKSLSKWNEGVSANWKFVFEDFRAFWLLINPTHSLSALKLLEPNSEMNSYSLFFSYLSKILMTWIIYQFIVSFRKFGKKL